MSDELQNKIALVTGAGRGIGRAIACRLAASGATVYVNDRDDVDECVSQIRAAGGTAFPALADVASAAQVAALMQPIAEAHSRLDVLVNNAAISRPRACAETTDEDWHAVLGVNLTGVFYCCRAALPLLQNGGRIVNLSSVSAYTGRVLSDNAAYVAAKAGVDGLTRALAREVAPRGITVNSVAPGIVATDIHAHLSPTRRNSLPALVPTGRLATSDEVAQVVRFLASPAGAHITGQVIHINGGMYFS